MPATISISTTSRCSGACRIWTRCPSVTRSSPAPCSSAFRPPSASTWTSSPALRDAGHFGYDQPFYMKSDAVAFGVAGIMFGLIAGWVIGSQEGSARPPAPAAPAAAAAPASQGAQAALLDQSQVKALTSVAERDPSNPKPRVELANLY